MVPRHKQLRRPFLRRRRRAGQLQRQLLHPLLRRRRELELHEASGLARRDVRRLPPAAAAAAVLAEDLAGLELQLRGLLRLQVQQRRGAREHAAAERDDLPHDAVPADHDA